MNGQLLLLMLAERLIDNTNCRVIQYNTDGIFLLIKKDKMDIYHNVIKEFEQLSRLQFEDDYYEAFYQFAINDYIAVKQGYSDTHDKSLIKLKGMFIDKNQLGKGLNALIIPKAIIANLVDKIPVEETVYNSKNIFDFITYQRIDKSFSVEYNNKLINRINRFYYSTDGCYLLKCHVDHLGNRSGYIKVNSKSGVTICNTIDENYKFPTNINYKYYISEINKILVLFKTKQLNLFDF